MADGAEARCLWIFLGVVVVGGRCPRRCVGALGRSARADEEVTLGALSAPESGIAPMVSLVTVAGKTSPSSATLRPKQAWGGARPVNSLFF